MPEDIEIRVEELGAAIMNDPDAYKLLLEGTIQAAREAGAYKMAQTQGELITMLTEYMG